MSEYTKFFVSNKIAIYSHDLKSVLIMTYPRRAIFGLPGGHLDPGEEPETGMARELEEELGISVENIEKAGFFMRNFLDVDGATVILAYKTVAPEGFETHPTDFDKEHALWMTPEEIPALDMSEGYKKFILENWPTNA